MITKEQLEEWREIINNTSPGPWSCDKPDWSDKNYINSFKDSLNQEVIEIDTGSHQGEETIRISPEDTAFIISSREAMPELIKEIIQLQTKNKEIDDELNRAIEYHNRLSVEWDDQVKGLKSDIHGLHKQIERLKKDEAVVMTLGQQYQDALTSLDQTAELRAEVERLHGSHCRGCVKSEEPIGMPCEGVK